MAVDSPTLDNSLIDQPAQLSSANSLAEKIGNSYVGVRNDLEVSRHAFFGETSYIVRDPISFEGHNFSPGDYEILISLTDERSLQEIATDLIVRGLLNDDQTEEFYRFVIELQVRGLLSLPITDGEALYNQYELKKRRQSANPLMKLMFLKIPLGCPDNFLRSTFHYVQFLFTRSFFAVWLLALLAAIFIVVMRWEAFTSNFASMLAIQNLPAILLIMSALKLWHELGHGYACRHYGVAVPNAGLMLMMGTPLAFVDATGSWSLPRRSQRQVINLAGIYFEMMIAIVAAFVWAFSGSASIQSLAHFTLLISSVTTIGFNFNPLMKYDGYYVLADSLGIPNLRGRASVATTALGKKIFFGIKQTASETGSMRAILVGYGVCAASYKWILVLAISSMLAMQIWIVGLSVGGYYFLSSLATMLWNLVKYLWGSDELKTRRSLAYGYLSFLLIGVPGIFAFCPVPSGSHARGVVESETIRVVHVEEAGFLTKAYVRPSQTVTTGQTVGTLENIAAVATTQRKQAELRQLEMKYRSEQLVDRVQANQTLQKIQRQRFELDLQSNNQAVQFITAPISGCVLSCAHQKGTGQYLAAGEELLRIGSSGWVIRAVANSRSLADIKPAAGQTVHCRFYSDPQHVFPATIQSLSGAGSRIVKHESLTQLAGGFIPVNPETLEATEPFFEMEIVLTDSSPEFLRNGAVCEIRFERKYEPLWRLLHRSWLRLVNQINLK